MRGHVGLHVGRGFHIVTMSISVQVFAAIEAMSDGGVKMGLPRDLAIKLAAQTMMVRIRSNRYQSIHTVFGFETECLNPVGLSVRKTFGGII